MRASGQPGLEPALAEALVRALGEPLASQFAAALAVEDIWSVASLEWLATGELDELRAGAGVSAEAMQLLLRELRGAVVAPDAATRGLGSPREPPSLEEGGAAASPAGASALLRARAQRAPSTSSSALPSGGGEPSPLAPGGGVYAITLPTSPSDSRDRNSGDSSEASTSPLRIGSFARTPSK